MCGVRDNVRFGNISTGCKCTLHSRIAVVARRLAPCMAPQRLTVAVQETPAGRSLRASAHSWFPARRIARVGASFNRKSPEKQLAFVQICIVPNGASFSAANVTPGSHHLLSTSCILDMLQKRSEATPAKASYLTGLLTKVE